jgi:hypothetical protein
MSNDMTHRIHNGFYDNKFQYPQTQNAVNKKLKAIEDALNAEIIDKETARIKKKEIEDRLKSVHKERAEYNKEQNRLNLLFKSDLLAELGMSNHPKKEEFFQFCLEKCQDDTLYGVYSYAVEIKEILEKFS